MRCVRCSSTEDKVIDSRISRDGSVIRRRRECLACGHRFTTAEEILHEELFVVKSDGSREEFDRHKVLSGLRKACEKRPVDPEQLNMIVSDLMAVLESRFGPEIPSQAIGEIVMEKLKPIDKVAYVRFASVYKDFHDIADFADELRRIEENPVP